MRFEIDSSSTRRLAATARLSQRFIPRVSLLEPRTLLTLTVQVRYDYDTSNFFDTPAKRALLESTVNQAVAALGDHLAAIVPSGSDTWQAELTRPDTGQNTTLTNLTVPADTLILFVGSSNLGGASGEATPGSNGIVSGDLGWQNLVAGRGKPGATGLAPTAVAPWGGSISFDPSQPYGPGDISLTLHELAHVLGLGTSSEWYHYVTPAGFTGPNAEALNNGQPIPLAPDNSHFAANFPSDGTGAALESGWGAGMYPLHLTSLDYAALTDIGWSLTPSRFQFASPQITLDANGDATVTVVRLGDTSTAASVQYATNNLFATFAAVNGGVPQLTGSINFAPGVTTQTFQIHVPLNLAGPSDIARTIPLVLEDPSGGPAVGPMSSTLVTLPGNGESTRVTVHVELPGHSHHKKPKYAPKHAVSARPHPHPHPQPHPHPKRHR